MIDMMIDDIVNFTASSDFISTVTMTAKEYGGSGNIYYGVVMKFMKDVSFGIGASLLCLFMLMELIAIIQRGDNGGGIHGMQIPANILIKWGIYTFLFCHLNVVLDGIQEVAKEMANSGAISSSAPNVQLISTTQTIKDAVKALGLIEELFADLVIILVWLIMNLFKSFISVLLIFRMFELWIMIMFAPIPLATLPMAEFRQTAINYLKSFVALCLTGVIILAAFTLYSSFAANQLKTVLTGLSGGILGFLDFAGAMLTFLCYVSVLVVTVFNAGKLAKSIMNAV